MQPCFHIVLALSSLSSTGEYWKFNEHVKSLLGQVLLTTYFHVSYVSRGLVSRPPSAISAWSNTSNVPWVCLKCDLYILYMKIFARNNSLILTSNFTLFILNVHSSCSVIPKYIMLFASVLPITTMAPSKQGTLNGGSKESIKEKGRLYH